MISLSSENGSCISSNIDLICLDNGGAPASDMTLVNGVSGATPFGSKVSGIFLSFNSWSMAFAPPASSHL